MNLETKDMVGLGYPFLISAKNTYNKIYRISVIKNSQTNVINVVEVVRTYVGLRKTGVPQNFFFNTSRKNVLRDHQEKYV